MVCDNSDNSITGQWCKKMSDQDRKIYYERQDFVEMEPVYVANNNNSIYSNYCSIYRFA